MAYIEYYKDFYKKKYADYLSSLVTTIKKKESYSWIRIGDGEIVFLEQEIIRPVQDILKSVGWSRNNTYCGATVPNLELRDRLIEAVKHSNMIGIFQEDQPTLNIFQKLNIAPTVICNAFDNVYLPMNAYFVNNILLKNRLLLVGKDSTSYAKKFKEILNVDVVGTVSINGYEEVEKCMNEMAKYDYDVALVSAGVNAKIICYEMSTRFNRVYLDMGHAWDNAFHPPGSYDEYFLIGNWHERDFSPNELVIYNDFLYKNISSEKINTKPDIDNRWMKMELLI